MRKIVRLTEGDLHRIISESVNNVIQELDWRTYRNAYFKSTKRAEDYDKQARRKDNFLNRLFAKKKTERELQRLNNLYDKEDARAWEFFKRMSCGKQDEIDNRKKQLQNRL